GLQGDLPGDRGRPQREGTDRLRRDRDDQPPGFRHLLEPGAGPRQPARRRGGAGDRAGGRPELRRERSARPGPIQASRAATTESSWSMEGAVPWAMRALPPPRPPAWASSGLSRWPASTPLSAAVATTIVGGVVVVPTNRAFPSPVIAWAM